MGHDIFVSKKEILELVEALADTVLKVQHKPDATARQVTVWDASTGESELKVQLLTDDPVELLYLERQLLAQNSRIAD